MNNRKAKRHEARRQQIREAAALHASPAQKAVEAMGLDASAIAMDAFSNLAARMGYGTPSLAEGTDYQMVRWSNDYWLMLTLYRNHWIARRIVETPARDMVKAWPRLVSAIEPTDLGLLNRTITRTMTKSRYMNALKWGDLFGGAGALIVIDGHEDILSEPLDLDDINPGTYKGLIVFDRWSGITPSNEIGTDINRPVDFGLPASYTVRSEGTSGGDSFEVHASRILRCTGPDVPAPEFQASMRWGISGLEPCFEEIRKRDNASWSILQLLFRAQIIAQRDPELAQILSGAAMSATGLSKYHQRMQAQNELLSNNSMMILGKDGELFSNQFSFSGLSDVYQQFQLDIAGAAQIPVSRLFGRTITGLGQSNDADERIYEERIAMEQEERMRPQMDKLYPVILMSEFGEVPDDYDLMFPTIRALTEKEKSEMAKGGGELIATCYGTGLITKRMALMELAALSDQTGVFTSITPEDIEAAPNEFAEADVAGDEGDDGPAGGENGEEDGGGSANDAADTTAAVFHHPAVPKPEGVEYEANPALRGVSPRSLVPTQPRLYPEVVARYADLFLDNLGRSTPADLVIDVTRDADGNFLILDGHHRASGSIAMSPSRHLVAREFVPKAA